MDEFLQATIEKVAKITGELLWIRAALLTLVAALFLIFSQLISMQQDISDLSADFAVFKVHVNHKFEDIETDVSELKAGQLRIVSTLERMQQQLAIVSDWELPRQPQ